MVSNGMIDVSSDDSSSTGVTAMGSGSGGGTPYNSGIAGISGHIR